MSTRHTGRLIPLEGVRFYHRCSGHELARRDRRQKLLLAQLERIVPDETDFGSGKRFLPSCILQILPF